MNYARIRPVDVANGPGIRVSLWVSGCPHHCEGCFNPETWDYDYGKPFGEEQIEEIIKLADHDYVDGLSVLGGEPLAPQNQEDVRLMVVEFLLMYYPKKTVWLYTGYLWEDIVDGVVGQMARDIIGYVDVLVDGPFIAEQKDLSLRFRGSRNQRVIDVQRSLREEQVTLMEGYYGSMRRATMAEQHDCSDCKWHEDWDGICFNGDSKHCSNVWHGGCEMWELWVPPWEKEVSDYGGRNQTDTH